jgi:ferredoxin-thioredoxin reductase catalytic chain
MSAMSDDGQVPEQQPKVEDVTDADRAQASQKNIDKMWKFVRGFAEKSGSYLHPQEDITEFLVIGLAKHIDEVGRPLCPCNFYEDKVEEAKSSTWVCACEEMQKYKYCH